MLCFGHYKSSKVEDFPFASHERLVMVLVKEKGMDIFYRKCLKWEVGHNKLRINSKLIENNK